MLLLVRPKAGLSEGWARLFRTHQVQKSFFPASSTEYISLCVLGPMVKLPPPYSNTRATGHMLRVKSAICHKRTWSHVLFTTHDL